MRAVAWLLLLAVWCAGVAHLATLPPFEGYDETAHWSYVQQLAQTGHIPVYGQDTLSADLLAYPGPMASPEGQPYRDYFQRAAPGDVAGAGPTRYAPGRDANWQAQHPPLFYAVMAPAYWLAADWRWPWHMFALRLASWTLGFAGFAWGAWTTQALLRRQGVADARLLLPMAWPFLFAEFFPEFARLTNDDLCLLLAAGAWTALLAWLEAGPSRGRAVALGALLGAGLLTKAFFLPVTAGVALLLLADAARRQPRRWGMALLAPALAAVIGGAWYVAKYRATGSLTGANDMIALQAQGGLLAGLRAHFSPVQYAAGLVRIVASFCSAGTWSFAHPSRLFVAPVAALALLPLARYARRLPRLTLPAIAPVFVVGPVLAGLLYHLLGMVAWTGVGSGTPGWYLHIFAGPLAAMLALGWGPRWAMRPLLAYALAFSALSAALQLAFFSGCLPRAGLGAVSPLALECVARFDRLGQLALPGVAAAAGAVGGLALLGAALRWRGAAAQAGTG